MNKLISNIEKEMLELNKITLEDISSNVKDDTALIVVDMINGFYTEGMLASDRVEGIITPIVNLIDNMKECEKIIFVDNHTINSTELNTYPLHCIENSSEVEIISEIKERVLDSENYEIIKKNSINGFHAAEFKEWLDKNNQINNFIIVGVCTDICVETLAISLVTYFNENNIDKKIIIPKDSVETYSVGNHDGDLMNILSLFKMKSNGINVVESIIS
ncbi:isochorismatase family cysteine hydrolase [Clostridium sardiniense]|uniref:isochorismatase family cysteine hydrolase n=1 Tax=Clostridium sardiniense TaxID=29369 RepID=UPI003D348A1B